VPLPGEGDGGVAPEGSPNGGAAPTNGTAAPATASPPTGTDNGAEGTAPVPAPGRGRGRGGGRGNRKGRGRPPSRLFDIRTALAQRIRWALATVGLVSVLGLWLWAASREGRGIVVPSPAETWSALRELHEDGDLWSALGASGYRILYGYAISMAIGIVLGLLMGTLQSVEAFVEAPIGFMRYVPAGALTPLMIAWLGIDETPKITLIVIGTVFFNVLMVADVARAVPRELIEASYTLGARRTTVLSKIIFRHSLPGIIDVARINLAAGWLMLVVAELLAAEEGLAVLIMKVQRARAYDTMFAVLFVFGVVGVLSDLLLRWLRNRSAPWARP
jgi:NitT/TauT family transport system permease protein